MPCCGGSSNMITPPGSSTPARMMSRMSLRVFVNVCQFDEPAFDVGVARQRPEVEALVVVDRRFVAEARVGRVGVGVDVDVVGVEVHPGVVHDRHPSSPSQS